FENPRPHRYRVRDIGAKFLPPVRRSSNKICEVPNGWIIAVKAHHPFIGRKADRRESEFKVPGECGLARTEISMNQMSRRHKPHRRLDEKAACIQVIRQPCQISVISSQRFWSMSLNQRRK